MSRYFVIYLQETINLSRHFFNDVRVNDAPIETRLISNKDIAPLKVRAFASHRLSWNAGHVGNASDGEEAIGDDVRVGTARLNNQPNSVGHGCQQEG